MPAGRPTDYRIEYCEMLVDHMKQGKSFESFGPKIGTHRATLYEWVKKHPEFHDAKKRAVDSALSVWEDLGLDLARGDVKGNAAAWIFSMKNRFPDLYKDKQEVETTETKKIEMPIIEDEQDI